MLGWCAGWAIAVGMSRCFALTKRPGHTMVPLIDMANHRFTSNAEIRGLEDGTVAMVANKRISAGQPIYLKYGSHDNRDLLLSYGFVVQDNPFNTFQFDFDVDVVLQCVEQFAGVRYAVGYIHA